MRVSIRTLSELKKKPLCISKHRTSIHIHRIHIQTGNLLCGLKFMRKLPCTFVMLGGACHNMHVTFLGGKQKCHCRIASFKH